MYYIERQLDLYSAETVNEKFLLANVGYKFCLGQGEYISLGCPGIRLWPYLLGDYFKNPSNGLRSPLHIYT